MKTKPYAGEKIIYKPRKVSWWGPGDISLSQALFLDPIQQQQIRNGTYHSGKFYVTNKRIIFEGDEISKECIIYFEEIKSFKYNSGGFWKNSSLHLTKGNGMEERFMLLQTLPNDPKLTKNLYVARENAIKAKAIYCEDHLDYIQAISLWDKLGKPQEAARIRKLVAEQGSVKVDQTVVHGDYVDDRDTIVKDSVVNKSNIGAGGKSKAEEIKEIKELLDSGAINEDDYEKMKREIIG